MLCYFSPASRVIRRAREIASENNDNSNPRGHGSPNETDRKRLCRPYQSKTFKVKISFAAKIQMQAIANALRGQESENSQETLRVLDIILWQHAAKYNSPCGHGILNKTDRKRLRRPYQSKTFKMKINFAAKIPMQATTNALRGQESENSQEALRVLDIILRQHVAKQNNGNTSPSGLGIPNETDRKRLRCPYQSKTFKVKISSAVKIQMQAITNALRGQESENSQEALRDRDIHYFRSYNQDTDKNFNLLSDICSIRELELMQFPRGDAYFLVTDPESAGSHPQRVPPPIMKNHSNNNGSCHSDLTDFTRHGDDYGVNSKTTGTVGSTINQTDLPSIGIPALKTACGRIIGFILSLYVHLWSKLIQSGRFPEGLLDDDLRESAYEVFLACTVCSGLEVRLAESKKKEKSPRFLSGLKRREKRHSRSLSGSLTFDRNSELIEIFRTQMQASCHCLCS
ncbi:Protein argonaute 4 [Capsicum chinense]|nr:Protein argonaute 4 [Capsicum chinense]